MNNSPTATQPLDTELLAKQVATWRAEIARLQDLIDHATGSTGAAQPLDLDSLRNLIADDGHAATFQSFGQYRSALLKAIDQRAAPMNDATAPSDDPVVEANRKLLLDRGRVGIKKYGTTLAAAGLSRVQLAQHALEEALDLANYLQTIIQTDGEQATPIAQARAARPVTIDKQALLDEFEHAIGGWSGGLVDIIDAIIQEHRAAPNCGACPGDGSICKTECRHRAENPPAGAADTTASASGELGDIIDRKCAEVKAVVGDPWGHKTPESINAARYERLRILGAAPYGSSQLAGGTVLRFQSLDAVVDADLDAHPSRGEAAEAAQQMNAVMAVPDDKLDNHLRDAGLDPVECEAVGRRALDAALDTVAAEQAAAKAPAAQADARGMLPLSAGLPLPDDHDRVLIYTEGSDFAGEQYFDIKTDDLWEPDREQQKEVVEHATHWMPLPRPGAASPASTPEASQQDAAVAAPSVTNAEIYTLRRLIECAEKLDERPRPMCRDCADENGTCPNSGLECDMHKLFVDAKVLHNKLAAPTAAAAATSEDIQSSTDARDAALITARDAINVLLHQFTATPSTFRDSNARCQGHEAIKAIDDAMRATQQEGE